MNQTFRLVFIAAALATLAGCGNKGPLVLPTPPAAPIEPATEPATPATPAEAPTTEPAMDSSTPPAPTTPVPPSNGDGNG
jgi:predicted small lipoprotein YifL